ncbi:MAG: flagellar motor switch protein FliM [Gammaproteobacteria bacterium]
MDHKEVLTEEETQALRESDLTDDTGDQGQMLKGEVRDLHPDHWERIVADQVPALESISERMVSLLKTTGREFFQESVDITVMPGMAYRWGDYARQLPVPTGLNIIRIQPNDLKGVICMSSEFIFALVDVFFGGNGQGERSLEVGDFTPMEQRLVRRFVDRVCADLREAWNPFIDLEFQLEGMATNPIFASVAGGSDAVSVSGFEFQIREQSYELQTVFPARLVEPLRFLQDAGQAEESAAESVKWRKHLKSDVRDARIELRAILTETQINLRDIMTARQGDVISMDQPSRVTIFAGDEPVAEGTFGVCNGNNAVQVHRLTNARILGERHD